MQLKKKDFSTNELWVIVPVKPLERSKQRLKDRLGSLRPGLTLAMLHDVLDALQGSRVVKGVVVVTLDAEVTKQVVAKGVEVEKEAGSFGMNRAIIQGFEAAKRAGATRLAVVPVDIPLLTGPEFDRLVNELQSRSVAAPEVGMGIVPSADRTGTNWLCIGTKRPFTPMYGPDSYLRHVRHAQNQGHRPVTLSSPPVSLDIDEATDIEAFVSFCHYHPEFQATNTWRFLHEIGQDEASNEAVRSRATKESSYACSKP